jgi:hypothetical protein
VRADARPGSALRPRLRRPAVRRVVIHRRAGRFGAGASGAAALVPPARLAPALVLALALGALVGCGGGRGDDPAGAGDDRRAEVAERGAEIMPFDLDATTHRFDSRPDGLVQTVVADDPEAEDGGEQVALVREHLADEAERFTRGDFGDPASIHGEDMPGLAVLSAGVDGIAVAYTEVPAGARITYTTDEPELVEALHLWAEAQVSDHGDHAEHTEHAGSGGVS